MRIELTIRRKGGSHVELDGTTYHFAPSAADPRHTAEVTNKAHLKRLLSIDGYEPDEGDEGDTDATPQADPATPIAPEPEVIRVSADDLDGDDEGEADEDDAEADDLDALDDDALRTRFEAMLHRAPHPAMKRDNLIAKIREAIEMQTAGA